jgi:hypothetical protein
MAINHTTLGFAGLDVGKRCTSQVWRWGGGGVLDCLLISVALRVSLHRWLLVRGARFWWIPSWVVASRSSIEELVYECHLAIHKVLAHVQSMALRHIVRTASTDMQTHTESHPHRRTHTHQNIERDGRSTRESVRPRFPREYRHEPCALHEFDKMIAHFVSFDVPKMTIWASSCPPLAKERAKERVPLPMEDIMKSKWSGRV